MGSTAHSLILQEVFQATVIVGYQRLDADIHLRQVQAGCQLEESSYAHIQVFRNDIAITVGHQLGQLVVQTNFILKTHRHISFGRKHETNEAGQSRILIDEMSQFMPDNELQLIGCHQIKQGRIDVDNMRFSLLLSCYRKSVDRRITCNIEIHWLFKIQLFLHIMTQAMEIRQKFLVHLQAVSFHVAPPVSVASGHPDFLEHFLYYRTLQGIVNLLTNLSFQFNRWIEIATALYDIDVFH